MTNAPRQGLTAVPRPNAVSGTADRLMRLRTEPDAGLDATPEAQLLAGRVPCSECGGRGWEDIATYDSYGPTGCDQEACTRCSGTGAEPAPSGDASTSPLDFAGPLDRLSLTPLNRSADHFTRTSSRHEFILDAPYQRGSVWDETRKQQLIRSMLLGLPIGNIVINRRADVMEGDAVVDGRQRIEAIRDFVDSKFPIPATWLRDEWVETPVDVPGWPVPGVYFDGGTTAFQRYMEMRPVPTVEASVGSIAAEAEVFRLINSGGIAQTAETMAKAALVEQG